MGRHQRSCLQNLCTQINSRRPLIWHVLPPLPVDSSAGHERRPREVPEHPLELLPLRNLREPLRPRGPRCEHQAPCRAGPRLPTATLPISNRRPPFCQEVLSNVPPRREVEPPWMIPTFRQCRRGLLSPSTAFPCHSLLKQSPPLR